MFWRRKKSNAEKRGEDPSDKLQHWERDPSPLDAVAGRGAMPDTGKGTGEVYPDEIDPEWRDPESAE